MGDKNRHLKKIPVAKLRLGMHLHALEGNWLDHPFWKTRFMLKDPADIRRLLDSPVRECWINTDRGLDLPDEAAPDLPAPRTEPAAAVVAVTATEGRRKRRHHRSSSSSSEEDKDKEEEEEEGE